MWNTPMMRELQLNIVKAKVFLDSDRPDVVLEIYATGSSKTHIIRIVIVIKQGIVLIFIPLSALSDGVMVKFTDALQQYSKITVHHFDQLWDNNKSKYGKVISCICDSCVDLTSTIFVFVLQQLLVFRRDALQVMLGTIDRCMHCTSVLDKFHLHVQHGELFWHQIGNPLDLFFRPVKYAPMAAKHLCPLLVRDKCHHSLRLSIGTRPPPHN